MLKKSKYLIYLAAGVFIILNLVFAIFLMDFVEAAEDNTGVSEITITYDIRENSEWINNESVDIVMEKNSIIIFDVVISNDEFVEIAKCQLALTNVQRTIKSAALSLRCLDQNPLPIAVRKSTSKEIDIDYNDKSDVVLLLKKIDLREEKITLSISKFVEIEKKGADPIAIVIIALMVIAIALDFYYHYVTNKKDYKKIKEKIDELGEYLSLKEHEKVRNLYNEVNDLYKKLTRKQKKELHQQISEMFKQFEDEESIISQSKL